jgi:hypothetical protein
MLKINQQLGIRWYVSKGVSQKDWLMRQSSVAQTATFPDALFRSGRDPDRRKNAGREK